MKTVTFNVELTESQADAYMRLLNRVGFADYSEHANSQDEAYLMRDAGFAIQSSLSDVEYSS